LVAAPGRAIFPRVRAPAILAVIACGCGSPGRSPEDGGPRRTPAPAGAPPAAAPGAEADAGTGGIAAAVDAIGHAEPPPPVQAQIVVLETPAVADRPLAIALRVSNDGHRPVRLRPAAGGGDATATLRVGQDGETIGEAPLAATAFGEAFAGEGLEVGAGDTVDVPLAAPRAPTTTGTIVVGLTLRVRDERERVIAIDAAAAEIAVTWSGVSVLHIGDSMVSRGLTRRFGELIRAAGGAYRARSWTSSNAARWSTGEHLRDLLWETMPDVVLVTLGTNEYLIPEPHEYARWYERLAALVGSRRRCFWIGPPRLPGSDAFIEAVATRTAPCPFFDSRGVPPPRDGPRHDHYGAEGGAAWADAVWAWMRRQWRP
jgi:hypothetical protein